MKTTMVEMSVKKVPWMRTRFVREKLDRMENWFDLAHSLREKILLDSRFQIVGSKTYLELDFNFSQGFVMFEVLGVPQVGFDTIDYEPREILKYDYPETIYSTSMKDLFDAVSICAEELRREVTTPLEEIFHLVFDGKKIALHFFIQKDYIQC